MEQWNIPIITSKLPMSFRPSTYRNFHLTLLVCSPEHETAALERKLADLKYMECTYVTYGPKVHASFKEEQIWDVFITFKNGRREHSVFKAMQKKFNCIQNVSYIRDVSRFFETYDPFLIWKHWGTRPIFSHGTPFRLPDTEISQIEIADLLVDCIEHVIPPPLKRARTQ